jgi:hypothetical protein
MSAFEAKHIKPSVKRAIFKKIEALNKVGLTDDNPTLNPNRDTKNSIPSFDTSALEPRSNRDGLEQTNALSYQLVRNTFVRLSVDIPLENEEGETSTGVLNFASYIKPTESENRLGTKIQTNTPLAFNKSPFTNDKKFIWRGHTGITSVSVTQKTFFIKEIQVGWECPDPIDFEERVLPFFLQHGRLMVVEFGWGLDSDLGNLKVPPLTKNNMNKFLKNLQERNNKSVDSYQAEAGVVTSYNYSITDEGGYKGTLKITSRGENPLYTPIPNLDDTEEPNPYVKSYTRSTGSLSVERAVNQTITFRATINNLEDFITDYLKQPTLLDNDFTVAPSAELKNIPLPFVGISDRDKRNERYRIEYYFRNGAMTHELVYRKDEFTAKEVNEKTIKLESSNNLYCSWGWFEDVILNSFFQIDIIPDVGDKFSFQQIRSVHSPYRYELNKTELDKVSFKAFNDSEPTPTDIIDSKELFSNRCNNNPNLYSLGFDDIILPGQYYNIAGNTRNIIERDLKKGSRINEKTNENIKITKSDRGDLTKRLNQIIYLEKLSELIDDKFKPFGKPNEYYGNIRNMVFSVDYLKSHFENINSVEEGLRSLWSDVSSKYGGFFNFTIYPDEKNNGTIGINDQHYMNPIERDEGLLDEPNVINYEKYIEGKKSLSNPNDMMQFSVFSKDSIISSYDLNLQLTKEAATLALYGGQQKLANGNFTNSSTIYDKGIEGYTALQNAIIPDFKKSNKNLKLGKDKRIVDPIVIKEFSTPITDDGVGLDLVDYNKDSNFISEPTGSVSLGFKDVFSISKDFKKLKDEVEKKLKESKELSEGESADESAPEPTSLDLAYPLNYDNNGGLSDESTKRFLSKLNHSNYLGDKSNWTIQKTIIPIDLDLTIDGIGGLVPGNLFRIDFLPETYRKYTYFIIMSINHSITTSGWSTSINAKMKLDFPKMIKDKLVVTEVGTSEPKTTIESSEPINPNISSDVLKENETQITAVGGITESSSVPANSYRVPDEAAGLTLREATDEGIISAEQLDKIDKLRKFHRKLRKRYNIPFNVVFIKRTIEGETYYDALPGPGFSTDWEKSGQVRYLEGERVVPPSNAGGGGGGAG